MLLSLRHRFLFVHTIRTGGTSVARALEPFCEERDGARWNRTLSKMGLVRDPARIWLKEHETALGARRLLPAEVFDGSFKFAFVRNPWSWIVSVWMRLRTTESHRHYPIVSKMDFPEYVAWEIGRNRHHQHRFVCDRAGDVIVDFIGRQERMAADFATVCERIGLGDVELPHVGARARKHADFREYYDDDLRRRVGEHWRRDVELFGYSFDG
ncbi:MAG TPA: sulfotransferase [Planctomycetes bacterium]|nr:sulfotransferase [Planctomycetota bacterium]